MLTLLIDADDTLWESNIYYQRCSANLEDWLVSLGITREAVAPAIAYYEREVIAEYGYSPYGYIEALVRSTALLARKAGIPVTPELLAAARAWGEPMLQPPIELMPDVQPTLAVLSTRYRLVLVTKGDPILQRRKLERSGLGAYFHQVYVLNEKDSASYQRIITREQVEPAASYMVGNSPKSDINPALAAGLNAVFIPHDHTWTAEYEEIPDSPRVTTLVRFSDLPAYLASVCG